MKTHRRTRYLAIVAFGLLSGFQVAVADAGDSSTSTTWGSGPAQLSHDGAAPNWSGVARQVPHNSVVNANHNVGNSHAGVGTSTGPARSMGSAGHSGFGAYGYGNNKTGPNGMAIGYGKNNNNPMGPNGKAVGSGYNNPMGINGKPIMGSQHASGGGGPADQYGGQGVDLNNGGMAGASSGNDGGSSSGNKSSGGSWQSFKNGVSSILHWAGGSSGGTTDGGQGKSGGNLDGGYGSGSSGSGSGDVDSNGVYHGTKDNMGRSLPKIPVLGGGNGKLSAGDMPDSGGGGGPNATGQFVNKGNAGGGDSGGGQTDQGSTGGAPGRSGSGSYFNGGAINGGDAPLRKPVDTTPLNASKLNNGVTDPKRSGAIGH